MIVYKLKTIISTGVKSLLIYLLSVILPFIIQSNATAQTVNATSSLPVGCNECAALPPFPPINITETVILGCGGEYGYAAVAQNAASHTYTISPSICFDNGKWKASIDSVNTTMDIVRNCPSSFPTVLCIGGVAGLTKAQACTQLARYPSPIPATGFDAPQSGCCWCRECVAAHEEAHMNIDWIQDTLTPEINTFIRFLDNNGVSIDCSTPSTLNCINAITATVQANYDTEWQARMTAAINIFNGKPEGRNGYNAEIACYQQIINALTTKCTGP
ncbi:MAG: hypothetical protein GY749_26070 [Desulfobacteraceae bacterium]|nr:hypothetical protein [Desulfobacteraceae bacterium]